MPALARWIGLPAARARCVGHLFGLAATLAAAKVVLSTVGVTLFVAEEGAAGLPFFYVSFAPLAILLSFGLGSIIDHAGKVRLAQGVFAILLIGSAGLRLTLAFGFGGTGFVLLGAATAFEILLEVIFWTLAVAYLDAFEIRRVTHFLYMGLALGGAAGGIAGWLAAGVLAAADLVLLLLPLAGLVVAQLQILGSRLDEVPPSEPERPGQASALDGAVQLGMLLRRYPLALLIALSALVVTLLYGLCEYLILAIYEDRFAGESELAAFLALLFALMQVLEFALLSTLTRLLLGRSGPLLRNLAYPAASLGTIGCLLVDPRLVAAVAVHVNIETLSNALFLPVNNANYMALPLGFQGRTRMLSEGVFFPLGLALAGGILWGSGAGGGLLQAEFAALVFALVLVLSAAGIGLLFTPTLRATIEAGLPLRPPLPRAASAAAAAAALPRVKALLRSREPASRLLGLDLARQHDLRLLEEELCTLADRPDWTTRAALASFVVQAPDRWRRDYLGELACRGPEAQKLWLLTLLIRREPPDRVPGPEVLDARDPVVAALARIARDPSKDRLLADADDPGVASQLLEATVAAARPDLAARLIEQCGGRADPEALRRALASLKSAGPGSAREVEPAMRRLLRHPDGGVRAGAASVLGAARRSGAALRSLAGALRDPGPRVRRAAADGLSGQGTRGMVLLRRPLRSVSAATVDAARALAGIGTPRARRVLERTLRDFQADAVRTDRMLSLMVRLDPPERDPLVGIALLEHRTRLGEVALAILLATVETPLAGHLRRVLGRGAQRERASAFELLAARSACRRAPAALQLLRYLMFEGDALAAPAGPPAAQALLETAAHSRGPWVRFSAAKRGAGDPAADDDLTGGLGMAASEEDLERVVLLKRTPMFRDLDLDVLLEVAKAVRARLWLRGGVIVAAGSAREGLLILESGRLSIGDEPVRAPACFGEVTLAGQPLIWPRITALEDARVGFLDVVLFEELRRDHPDLLVGLCQVLARRLRGLETKAALAERPKAGSPAETG